MKTCKTCEYYYKKHCCRGDSEHCCELVDKDMSCDKWEGKVEYDKKFIDGEYLPKLKKLCGYLERGEMPK